MSSRAGDKSRFNRLRKQKIQRRMKARARKIEAPAAGKTEERKPVRKAA